MALSSLLEPGSDLRMGIRLRERAVYASAQASYAAASTAGDSASGTTGTGLTSPAAG